jgi:hypothetical protein
MFTLHFSGAVVSVPHYDRDGKSYYSIVISTVDGLWQLSCSPEVAEAARKQLLTQGVWDLTLQVRNFKGQYVPMVVGLAKSK